MSRHDGPTCYPPTLWTGAEAVSRRAAPLEEPTTPLPPPPPLGLLSKGLGWLAECSDQILYYRVTSTRSDMLPHLPAPHPTPKGAAAIPHSPLPPARSRLCLPQSALPCLALRPPVCSVAWRLPASPSLPRPRPLSPPWAQPQALPQNPQGPCSPAHHHTHAHTVDPSPLCAPTHPPTHRHHDGVSRSPSLRLGPRGLSQSARPWNRAAGLWGPCCAGADAQACNTHMCGALPPPPTRVLLNNSASPGGGGV